MKNLMLSNVSLTKILPNYCFYTDFYNLSSEKYKYTFDLSEIYERKNKIKIFLRENTFFKNENFDSLDSLLDYFLNSGIEYLNSLKSSILTQNIFVKLINKNKNINLIEGSSFEHINQRFNFIQKHFEFCFVRNRIGKSLSNDSIKINILKPLNINDIVFSLERDSTNLRKLVVVYEYVKVRFDIKDYLLSYEKFEEKINIHSEDYYSFAYQLKDIETNKTYYCNFNHQKKCYELSDNQFLFLNYEEFEKHIYNSQLSIDTLKFNNGIFNL